MAPEYIRLDAKSGETGTATLSRTSGLTAPQGEIGLFLITY
jgi:hypothetical protein